MTATGIGIIGCGAISGIYGENLSKFAGTEVRAVADIDPDRARKFGMGSAMSVDELLDDPLVDIVLNLTIPAAHGSIAAAAIHAGKSVYNEKPLCLSLDEAINLLGMAREQGVSLGCAPDTFLGASHQTCRTLIDDGAIGVPLAGTAFMMCAGHESWHPSPAFYYQVGGGPMLDMGPYYVTALVNLLGPVASVVGMHQASFPTRTITSEPLRGQTVAVEVPTHTVGILKFASGAIVSLVTSFEVHAHTHNPIEIYGSEGTLQVPDPNGFGGTPILWTRVSGSWREVDVKYPYESNSRGLGVAQMAYAMRAGQPVLASGELATHVLAVMEGIERAGSEKREVNISTGTNRPDRLDSSISY